MANANTTTTTANPTTTTTAASQIVTTRNRKARKARKVVDAPAVAAAPAAPARRGRVAAELPEHIVASVRLACEAGELSRNAMATALTLQLGEAVTPHMVSRAIQENGIEYTKPAPRARASTGGAPGRNPADDTIAAVDALPSLIAEGFTMPEICSSLNIPSHKVKTALNLVNAQRAEDGLEDLSIPAGKRGPKAGSTRINPVTPEQVEQARAMIDAFGSVAAAKRALAAAHTNTAE